MKLIAEDRLTNTVVYELKSEKAEMEMKLAERYFEA